jgi:mannose-6-phosphate isomerase-like protein (cupin superfamily)
MHVFPERVEAKQVNEGVTERVLLPREQSASKMVEVKHLTLAPRGEADVPVDKGLEYAFYVINGRGLMQGGNRQATRGRILYSDTAVWAPHGGFVLSNSGEGEMRVLLISTKVHGEHYRFSRIRMKNFHHAEVWSLAGYVARPFFKEEDLVIAGTLRVHGMDVETLSPGYEAAPHIDPEEVLYVIRGEGEILSEGKREKVYPGTLCYHEAGTPHGIWNTSNVDEMQYMVIEFEDARERFAPIV